MCAFNGLISCRIVILLSCSMKYVGRMEVDDLFMV